MNMLSRLIRKAKLFSIFLIIAQGTLYSQTMKTIYEENFKQGTVLTTKEVLSLKSLVFETNVTDMSFWGILAANALLTHPSEVSTPGFDLLKRELTFLFLKVKKIKPQKVSIDELFYLGMLGYYLMAVYKILRIPMLDIYYYSKDIFRYVLFHYKNTKYAHFARTMLTIYLTFPANSSTLNYNITIKQNLTDLAINNLQDPIIRYISYIHKSMFYKKMGSSDIASYSLLQAKNIFPNALLHQVVESFWLIGKDGF